MNRGRYRRPNCQKAQASHDIWAWVKSKVSAIMEHRFYNKWLALLTLLSPIVLGLLSFEVSNTSSSSVPNGPSISGDHNTATYNNNVYENVTILNLQSTKDIECTMSAEKGRSAISDVIEPSASLQKKPIPQLLNSSELDFLAANAFHAWSQTWPHCINSIVLGLSTCDEGHRQFTQDRRSLVLLLPRACMRTP